MTDLSKFRAALLCATAVMAVMGAHGSAFAQEAEAETATTVDQVVVTAERRATDVQTTPIPVTVLNNENLEEKGVERLEDLQFATPSMTVSNAALTQNVTIRGIGLRSGSPRAAPGVAVYRDGVLVPQILNQTAFFDIASVEVLRGPQGTFAGSYSTGGAVYINSQDPKPGAVSGYVEAGAGNYNAYDIGGAVNMPISDTLAMRIGLDGQTRDSYYDFINGGGGSPQPGGLKELGGRFGLLWEPSPDFRAVFKIEGVGREAGGRDYRPRPGGTYASLAPSDPRTLDFDTEQSTREETYRSVLRLDYEFDNGLMLRSVTGGNYSFADNVDDLDGTAGTLPGAPGNDQHQIVLERTWSQEIDLISPDEGRFSWVLGAYYYQTLINVGIDQFTSPTAGHVQTLRVDITTRKGNSGVFAHGRYDITPALEVEVGLRWSSAFSEDEGAIRVFNVFGPGVDLVLANDGSYRDEEVTGKVGLNWTVDENNYLFAFVAKGFSPGASGGSGAILAPGFIANPGVPLSLTEVDAETVMDYEFGWRSTMLDGALRTQMGVFYSDYSNFQIDNRNLRTGQGGALVNADAATLYGFEAQAQLDLGDFQADASLAYINSSIDSAVLVDETPGLIPPPGAPPLPQCTPPTGAAGTPGPGCWNYATFNVSGNQMAFSPEWTFSVGVQYDFHLGEGTLTPRLNYSYIGEQWTSIQQSTAPINQLLEARTLLNVSLAYKQEDWRLRAFVNNVTDELYVSGTFVQNEFYGAPRTFGVEFSRQF